MTKGRVLFVLHPKFGHSTAHLRGLIYKDMLATKGWDASFASISSNKQSPDLDKFRKTKKEIIRSANDYDLIYLLKVNSFSFIRKLKTNSKAKIVFDLTDALWRPNFRVAWLNLEEILEISDAVFSENPYVCQYALKYNAYVHDLPACTQTEKFDLQRKNIEKQSQDRLIIGWIGTESTVNAVVSIAGSIKRLQTKYPHVDLRILGAEEGKLKRLLPDVRFSSIERYDEDDMIREALSMDIGLFPAPSDFDDYKIRGSLKAVIYMSAGIPAVCLNLGDPARLISDGVNGVLINSEDEWESKVEVLINDAVLREKMGILAYEAVKKRHSLESTFLCLEKAFLEVLSVERKPQKPKSITQKIMREVYKLKYLPIVVTAASNKLKKVLTNY